MSISSVVRVPVARTVLSALPHHASTESVVCWYSRETHERRIALLLAGAGGLLSAAAAAGLLVVLLRADRATSARPLVVINDDAVAQRSNATAPAASNIG